MAMPPIQSYAAVMMLAVLAMVPGCARQVYVPAPLDQASEGQDFQRDSLASAAAEMAAAGGRRNADSDAWTTGELGFLAAIRSPERMRATEQVGLDELRKALAGYGPPIEIGLTTQRNSDIDPGDSSRWSVGPSFEFVWSPADKGRIRVALADTRIIAARADELNSAWRARQRAVTSAVRLMSESRLVDLQQTRIANLEETVASLAALVDAGFSAPLEWQMLKLELVTARLDAIDQLRAMTELTAELAVALKLPMQTLSGLVIGDPEFFDAASLQQQFAYRDLRSHALRSHPRVLTALAEYERSEKALELAIAAQYPDLRLNPAYLFDQGDNIWSLVGSIVVPSSARFHAAVAAAEQARDVARTHFEGEQLTVIAELEAAYAAVSASASAVVEIRKILAAAEQERQSLEDIPQIEAGDELALRRAKLHVLKVRERLIDAEQRWALDFTQLESVAVITREKTGFEHYLSGLGRQ